MSSVIERLQRRRHYPIDIDGDDVFVRSLTKAERGLCEPFRDDEASIGYAIGVALVSEYGAPVFTATADESPLAFGNRVLDELQLPDDTRSQLVTAILKLSNGPTADQLASLKKK
tara:strand:+ start:419 stop:763 length:345 start_codon:yes stop_codon:yes gene_type:complete